MERNFLSLSFQNGSLSVKEEESSATASATNDSKSSAPEKFSGMQWSFSNKVSALPQFLSFKAPQDSNNRQIIRKTVNESSPIQHFDHSQEMKIFPLSSNQPNNQTLMSVSSAKNMVSSTMKPQSFGGVPVISPLSVLPSGSSVVGTTDLRNAPKSSSAPAQLTIFYGGSVSVYDDISPEKAQAIMLLAGNGSSLSQSKPPTAMAQGEASSTPRPSTADGFIRNWSHIPSSFTGIPGSISVTMHPDTQGCGGANNTNGLSMVKPMGASTSSSNRSEPPKVVSSVGPATTNAIPASSVAVPVPQARKASLARFLEKRKERVINTSPYNITNKSSDCGTPVSDVTSFSINSSSSSPVSAIN
uniref:Protein TIFY n=1 Tax=Cannabis sativa TaxID=3483 RepID=A0A803P7P6_CANSA